MIEADYTDTDYSNNPGTQPGSHLAGPSGPSGRDAGPRPAERAGATASDASGAPVRIDKWLWAARFFKTRGLAQDAIAKGRVLVGGDRIKVARLLRVGERVVVGIGDVERHVDVLGLSDSRGPAPVAQALYRETDASLAARTQRAEQRRLHREPALAIHGRPTKRDRRDLTRAKSFDGEAG